MIVLVLVLVLVLAIAARDYEGGSDCARVPCVLTVIVCGVCARARARVRACMRVCVYARCL